MKIVKRLLILFWFEVFLVWATVMKQAVSSKYDKELDKVVSAPAWDWNTFLFMHLVALAALILASAAFFTIKFVHEAEKQELARKNDEHIRNK